MKSAPGHAIAPPSGLIGVARLVLYEKVGPSEHACHWCGETVRWRRGLREPDTLIADHLNHDPADDRPENLVPSCLVCNAHRTRRGDRRRLAPDDVTVAWAGVPTRAIERTCEYCGDAFLIPPSATKRGRGRFCSRSCARKQNWVDRH